MVPNQSTSTSERQIGFKRGDTVFFHSLVLLPIFPTFFPNSHVGQSESAIDEYAPFQFTTCPQDLRTYFDNMDYNNLSGGGWDPPRTWLRVHGDTKSSVGGKFHMETMLAANGDFIAKIVGANVQAIVAPAGTHPPPTLPTVAAALRAAAGV